MKKLGIIISLIIAINLNAQYATLRFLYWQPSAKSMSLGGSGIGISNNSLSVYYNPSSISKNNFYCFSSSYVKPIPLFKNTIHSFTSFSFPIKKRHIVALSINSFWQEPQIWADEVGNELGLTTEKPELFKPTYSVLKLTYCAAINNQLSVGASFNFVKAKYLQEHIKISSGRNDGTSSNILWDFGLTYSHIFPNLTYRADKNNDNFTDSGVKIGISILNFGSKITFIDKDDKDLPPSSLLLGLSYIPLVTKKYKDQIFFEYENRINDKINFLHFGNELLVVNLLFFRAGYCQNNKFNDSSFFTYGAGIHFKYLSLNIARYNQFLIPTWHFDGSIQWSL